MRCWSANADCSRRSDTEIVSQSRCFFQLGGKKSVDYEQQGPVARMICRSTAYLCQNKMCTRVSRDSVANVKNPCIIDSD